MTYTIAQAAEITDLTPVTLRYYDKQGLLPFLKHKESGYRIFSQDDIQLLKIIECLKKTGMSIKEIKQFTDWLIEGDSTLEKRYEMFLERKSAVESQMAELQKTLEIINYKCNYYETAIAAGTEAIHFKQKEET